ncbi:MAG: phenylalanine--tRNA ligase subunit alpha [Deferribacteres bacterium]|nr:phenylalanine--tRNA ligase subunit alpha [candidate division KSB1 bacterium]MCB9501405.1 phenylalanine--tRNA ligase subunit alpha [Deferribacteres bacterium]
MLNDLDEIQAKFETDSRDIDDNKLLENLRVKYLGRKSALTDMFKYMGQLPNDQKPILGQKLNVLKNLIQDRLDHIKQDLKVKTQKIEIDLSLPGQDVFRGKIHPIMQILDEIKEFFVGLGFTIEIGREAENDFYNFEALNIPPDHPSRDMQDTFYLHNELLLRTHTSPVQIRTMEKQQPPIRMLAPGRCFRKDTPDATHSPMFHQVEGLVVDKNTSFAELKGILLAFARFMFGSETKIRFRPSFFPFTEPSAEVDIWWENKNTGAGNWLEILGCGMVDPAVFDAVNYDSELYSGYAFGMGIERIAMLKYQIADIRVFYNNDIRFLTQF